jgi:hypothetical protein
MVLMVASSTAPMPVIAAPVMPASAGLVTEVTQVVNSVVAGEPAPSVTECDVVALIVSG